MKGKDASRTSSINGSNGEKDICDMWYNHFKELLNSSKDASIKNNILNQVKESCESFNLSECCISQQEVKKYNI